MQRLDLATHDDAQFRIEIGQGFVEQEHLRVAHDGTAHRNTLALAAGKLARITVEQLCEAENIRCPVHFFSDFLLA
ncbi:hypothetical protein D3C80_1873760 [compost metagenome]